MASSSTEATTLTKSVYSMTVTTCATSWLNYSRKGASKLESKSTEWTLQSLPTNLELLPVYFKFNKLKLVLTLEKSSSRELLKLLTMHSSS